METIAIAGATGFIGRWLIEKLKGKYKFIALSRKKVVEQPADGVEWRQVDLYSMSSTENAIAGADYAIYLVHSMMPSTRLNQGSFEDTDLILADNFARAAEKNQLKQIIYLGGILPEGDNISRHLQSRYEVEQTLGSRSVPVTALRAGIIVGPGGSSFQIIQKLVQRIPIMICPKWTMSQTQPISLGDIIIAIDHCIGNPETYGKPLEVGGPDIMTYRDMMAITAKVMGKKRIIFNFPFFTPGLSKLWVSLFSDSSTTFVSPLIESLKYDLVARPSKTAKNIPFANIPFEKAVSIALTETDTFPKLPKFEAFQPKKGYDTNTVRSVQRLSNPGRKSASWVAKRYQEWLHGFMNFVINVKPNGEASCTFHAFNLKKPLLKLYYVPERSNADRQLFYITGGLLVRRPDRGWLEFREVLQKRYVMAAIHEFVPTLPWYAYVVTQAVMHLWVMRQFNNHLKKSEYAVEA